MLDQGGHAERQRRLALAGLRATRSLTDLLRKSNLGNNWMEVAENISYLESIICLLPNLKDFWVHNKQPEIENFTTFEIDKDGKVTSVWKDRNDTEAEDLHTLMEKDLTFDNSETIKQLRELNKNVKELLNRSK